MTRGLASIQLHHAKTHAGERGADGDFVLVRTRVDTATGPDGTSYWHYDWSVGTWRKALADGGIVWSGADGREQVAKARAVLVIPASEVDVEASLAAISGRLVRGELHCRTLLVPYQRHGTRWISSEDPGDFVRRHAPKEERQSILSRSA
jgi:hypothetical protein